jgi:hypothetical protein
VSPAAGTYSHAFSSAVLALLPHAQQPGAAKDRDAATALAAAALAGLGLAELLLMAHHPAVTAGVSCKQKTWQQASKRLLGAAGAALKGDCRTGLHGAMLVAAALAKNLSICCRHACIRTCLTLRLRLGLTSNSALPLLAACRRCCGYAAGAARPKRSGQCVAW